jgi:cellulose biosynthesis protein BcsQ
MYHILASSKGGVGKSTVSTIIAGYLHHKSNQPVKIIEIDDNNDSKSILSDSQFIKFESFDVKKGIDNMQEALFDIYDGQDIVIDAGGGNDSLKVVKDICGLGIDDKIVFYIPLLKNRAGMKNVEDMYKLIRSYGDAKIIYVFNQCQKANEKDIEKEFKYFFGDQKYAIDGICDEVFFNDANVSMTMIETSDTFDFAEEYKQSVWEIANSTLNKKELLESAKAQGKEAMLKTQGFIKIHNECVTFHDSCLLNAYNNLDEFLDLGI